MAMLVIMNKGERVYESVSHSIVSNSLQPCGLQPTRLLCPWDCPGNKGIQLENKRNRFNLGPLIHPLALVCGKTFTLNTLIVKTISLEEASTSQIVFHGAQAPVLQTCFLRNTGNYYSMTTNRKRKTK